MATPWGALSAVNPIFAAGGLATSKEPDRPGYSGLDTKQSKEAMGYANRVSENAREAMPGDIQSLNEMSGEQLRGNLRDRLNSNAKSFSSRGLLNSGLRAGDVGQAYGEYGGGLDAANQENTQAVRNNYSNMLQARIGMGTGLQQQQQDYNDQVYQGQLAEQQANSNMFGRPGRAAGGFLSSV